MNKTQRESLLALHKRGGLVPASEWVNGSGRYITKRAIPPHCERIERRDARKYPKRIQSLFDKRPRLQAVVAITNMRAANKELAQLA